MKFKRREKLVFWLLLTVAMCGCFPSYTCEAPCPGSSGQEEREAGIYCWCGSVVGHVFLWSELASCEQPRATWGPLVANVKGGCPVHPGGTPP